MKRCLVVAILCLGATSCAPFSSDLMRRVDPTVTLAEVQRDPQPFVGKEVLWGGIIAESRVYQNETHIFVRKTDLDYEKRPTHLDRSTGRFLVRYAGFLDPAIYRDGREISVIGEIAGREILPLSNTTYPYPIVVAKELHLWERRPVYAPVYPPWYW